MAIVQQKVAGPSHLTKNETLFLWTPLKQSSRDPAPQKKMELKTWSPRPKAWSPKGAQSLKLKGPKGSQHAVDHSSVCAVRLAGALLALGVLLVPDIFWWTAAEVEIVAEYGQGLPSL